MILTQDDKKLSKVVYSINQRAKNFNLCKGSSWTE